ncbi:MAG: hypothetical protein CO029_04620 [Candidatus Magasanikbacteria bacterium CG_4_9_14_0_2_um_filter_41_10]|nr:MAG: hypothetical protein CO029_04620 [Candidatus Magasanikbacteria bacterium CG_4_9_14_0_2_um_filter_41_10]
MDEEQIQVQTVTVSKTKMAVAIGLLGISALAAGFAGVRFGNFKPDLIVAHVSENGNDQTQLNEFSITLVNKGRGTVTSPFVLNVTLGDGTNIVKNIKVSNPLSAKTKSSYQVLESDTGSFDILVKNYRLAPGQTDTITFWFVLPSDYNSDMLPITYTWDTTNVVSEISELNLLQQTFDIPQLGFIKESAPITNWCLNLKENCSLSSLGDTTSCDGMIYPSEEKCQEVAAMYDWAPNPSPKGFQYTLVTSTIAIACQSDSDCNPRSGSSECFNGQETSSFTSGTCLPVGFCEVVHTSGTCEDPNVATSTTAFVTSTASAATSTSPVANATNNLPDLIVKDFTVTRSSNTGFEHFTIVIKNIGNATAVRPTSMHQNLGTFVVQLYFVDEHGVVTASNQFLSSDLYYSKLNLGPDKELTISKDLQIAFGNYTKIKMKVDWLDGSITSIVAPFIYPDKGYIVESNEDNNELTKDFQS